MSEAMSIRLTLSVAQVKKLRDLCSFNNLGAARQRCDDELRYNLSRGNQRHVTLYVGEIKQILTDTHVSKFMARYTGDRDFNVAYRVFDLLEEAIS